MEWRHFTCTLTKRKTIIVKDILNDTVDQLDYPNNIIQIEFGYDHLIAVSTKQCFVHPSSSWNTPIVVELKDGALFTILMSERY